MSDLAKRLMDAVGAIGYDRRVGPMGSFTYDTADTSPLTVPLWPGLFGPGVVMKPKDRPLSAEEAAHEGMHVGLGLPGALAGRVASKALGLGGTEGYLAPDEVAAYMSQPASPATSTDMRTLGALGRSQKGVYGQLVSALAEMMQKRGR
jgi:hypothetical protein